MTAFRVPGRSSAERGAATVYAAVLAVVATTACTIALHVAAVARLQHHVTAAADLAALAASQAALNGDDGCAAARRIATANATSLRACALAEAVATVVVERSGRVWGRSITVHRTARAAPSDYRPAAEEGP
ncbi:Rv3654c family TadE-like protein [Mumia sp. DW29H23]|uniref:Rv3654c family TadE-like protein n=1 Tax=Mumia sp. DW29H23 TaxID=3421241 RepID=UPI003D6829C1